MTFVKQIAGVAALLAALLLGLSAPSAQAGYIATLTQQASSVVASGSGTFDLTGLSLTSPGENTSQAGINPAFALINTGPTIATPVDLYIGITGPTSFGSGFFTPASGGSGDPVNIQGSNDILVVPAGYVSDSTLSDTATYDNATFASLGVTVGTYTWTWGSDGPNQNFTLIIGTPTSIPEPASLALLGGGVALLGLVSAGTFRRRSVGRGGSLRLDVVVATLFGAVGNVSTNRDVTGSAI
jgi:hypothetical protein